MVVSKKDILQYIPQRAPFIMIDNLIDVNDSAYSSSFKINKDNIFLNDGLFKPYGLIENIGQTAAAGIAYDSKEELNCPTEGYLGCVSKLTIHNEVGVGEELLTITSKINEIGDLVLISGKTYASGKLLIECNLHISKSKSQV
jgi:3-hydroxymyristoyl/3-hydroxydecanoyl-(acyl carrier protein) dehydratase